MMIIAHLYHPSEWIGFAFTTVAVVAVLGVVGYVFYCAWGDLRESHREWRGSPGVFFLNCLGNLSFHIVVFVLAVVFFLVALTVEKVSGWFFGVVAGLITCAIFFTISHLVTRSLYKERDEEYAINLIKEMYPDSEYEDEYDL